MFTSTWQRLLADHLNDCYRQRRVFREALNDVRDEFLTKVGVMHEENQERMQGIKKDIGELQQDIVEGQRQARDFQKWIFAGIIGILLSLLGWMLSHYGPFVVHVP